MKSQSPQTQKEYIRYLRLLNFNILCLQETHASTPSIIDSFNILFQPTQSSWTKHVGIISFSAEYDINIIDTSLSFASDRFQLCRVEHPQQLYEPFFILNIYAPANSATERHQFFQHLTIMLQEYRTTISFDRLIISGDFNYSILKPSLLNTSTSPLWIALLEANFHNAMKIGNLEEIHSFQRQHPTI